MHDDAPGPLYKPAAQVAHAAMRSPVSYVPAAQGSHALWPVAGWRHPAGQLAHAVWPAASWNVPAAQGSRVPSPGQKCPAAQAAAVHDAPGNATYVPAGHVGEAVGCLLGCGDG